MRVYAGVCGCNSVSGYPAAVLCVVYVGEPPSPFGDIAHRVRWSRKCLGDSNRATKDPFWVGITFPGVMFPIRDFREKKQSCVAKWVVVGPNRKNKYLSAAERALELGRCWPFFSPLANKPNPNACHALWPHLDQSGAKTGPHNWIQNVPPCIHSRCGFFRALPEVQKKTFVR